MEKVTYTELPPSEFRFGNYGYYIPTSIFFDNAAFRAFIERSDIVGIQKYPSFKAKPDCHAVMFIDEDDFNERWAHVPDYILF
jgi:hypothetical protein